MQFLVVSTQLKTKNEELEVKEKCREGKPVAPRRRKFDPFQSAVESHLFFCVPKSLKKVLSADDFCFLAKRYNFVLI